MRIIQSNLIALLVVASVAACTQPKELPPTSAQIESAGLQALHAHQPVAIERLKTWAQQGMPVAQRELALAYLNWPQHDEEAGFWLRKAASGGDSEAQFQLAETFYKGSPGLMPNHAGAWQWYERAAQAGNAKASFMLARMAKYGDGVAQDLNLSIHWLMESSHQGNAQAMFLLSNAYAAGEGVEKDASKAREWLEQSAAGDFPVAIQALAMSLDADSASGSRDEIRAHHLIKEANDERLLRWNGYQ